MLSSSSTATRLSRTSSRPSTTATPLRPWLTLAGLESEVLEPSLAALEAEYVTSVELLRFAWEEVKGVLQGVPRALVQNALMNVERDYAPA
eukprot:6962887-Prymnesium_polylepis.1